MTHDGKEAMDAYGNVRFCTPVHADGADKLVLGGVHGSGYNDHGRESVHGRGDQGST